MSKFNVKAVSNSTVNLAGGKAFSFNAEQELVFAVLSTFLEDKFYENGSDRASRIKALVAKVQPQFTANLALVARKEFLLRSVTTLLLGELARTLKGDSLVKDTIIEACERVDDLTELVAYVGTPVPKQVKRGVRNALLKFSRYQLAKYKGNNKAVTLVDLFNIVHPKVQHASKEQKKAWKDLMTGQLASFDTWETELSNAKDKKLALEGLIAEDKMGYMAVLRNLNNFIKYDISKQAMQAVIAKLVDPVEIKKSKQLPFRWYTAFQNVVGNRKLSDAISEAMDIAVSNVPYFDGNTLIAVDCSGSMNGDPIQKAAIFAATLLKANQDAEVILYDTAVQQIALSGRAPVIDVANSIINRATGGGTETSLVFKYAQTVNKKFERIIIISDNESWNEHSVQMHYEEYKRITEENPFVYAIDVAGYGTKDVTGRKVFHLSGWSSRLLDFIKYTEKDSLVEYIKNYHKQTHEISSTITN